MTQDIFTTQETAELLRVSAQTIIRWARRGKIAFVKLGKDYRFTQETIEGLLTPQNAKRRVK